MRRVLRNLVAAVACGSVAVLGACTGDGGAGPGGPTPSGDFEMPPAAAWALTAEEALAAMGETASGKVSVTQGWCRRDDEGGRWPDSLLVDSAWYQYWNGDGDGTNLLVCLLIGQPDEVGQVFTEMLSSSDGGNQRASVFDVAPIADGSFGYENAEADPGPSRTVVVNAGDALVEVSGSRYTWTVGEGPQAPTADQVEGLARAAVEKLGRDDVEPMLSVWAHDAAGLLTQDEVADVLGDEVRVTRREIPEVSLFPQFGVDVDASISAIYTVEWGPAGRARVWESLSRGPDVEAIYDAAKALQGPGGSSEPPVQWQVYDPAPAGLEAVGGEYREGEKLVDRIVVVNTGSVLLEIGVSSSNPPDTGADTLTREQLDHLVRAAVGKLAG